MLAGRLWHRKDGPYIVRDIKNGITFYLSNAANARDQIQRHRDELTLVTAAQLAAWQKNHEWEVERIVQMRRKGQTREFLVRWKGWEPSWDEWKSEQELNGCRKLIAEYMAAMDATKKHGALDNVTVTQSDVTSDKDGKRQRSYNVRNILASRETRRGVLYQCDASDGEPSSQSNYIWLNSKQIDNPDVIAAYEGRTVRHSSHPRQ